MSGRHVTSKEVQAYGDELRESRRKDADLGRQVRLMVLIGIMLSSLERYDLNFAVFKQGTVDPHAVAGVRPVLPSHLEGRRKNSHVVDTAILNRRYTLHGNTSTLAKSRCPSFWLHS